MRRCSYDYFYFDDMYNKDENCHYYLVCAMQRTYSGLFGAPGYVLGRQGSKPGERSKVQGPGDVRPAES